MSPPLLLANCVGRAAGVADLDALVELLAAHHAVVRGGPAVDRDQVFSEVVGDGSWVWAHRVVASAAGLIGWVGVRFCGTAANVVEADLRLVVDRDCPDPANVAAALFGFAASLVRERARAEGAGTSLLRHEVGAGDEQAAGWARAAGLEPGEARVHLVRPVDPREVFPRLAAGVDVRRIGAHLLPDGTSRPVGEDLRTVHTVLQAAFGAGGEVDVRYADFLVHHGAAPGRAWDHWWIATLDGRPVGAVVSSVAPLDEDARLGTQIDVIGVAPRARRRGVATALLHAVLADARDRRRSRLVRTVPERLAGPFGPSSGWAETHRATVWSATIPTEQ